MTMGVLRDFMAQIMEVVRPKETPVTESTKTVPSGTIPKKTTQSKPSGSISQKETPKCPSEKVSLGSYAPAPDTVDKSGDTSKPGTSGIPKETVSAFSDEEAEYDDDEEYEDEDDDEMYASDPESYGYDSERESTKNRLAYVSTESFKGCWEAKKYTDGSTERFLPIFTLDGDRIDFFPSDNHIRISKQRYDVNLYLECDRSQEVKDIFDRWPIEMKALGQHSFVDALRGESLSLKKVQQKFVEITTGQLKTKQASPPSKKERLNAYFKPAVRCSTSMSASDDVNPNNLGGRISQGRW